MWGQVRNSVNKGQVAPQSPPPPYKSRQNSPQSDPGNKQQPPGKDRNVYHGHSPRGEHYVGKSGGTVRGGKCGECCLGVACCGGGPGCFPFPGRDKNREGYCKTGCCGGPCCWACCLGEGVWPHLDPNTGKGKGVVGTCCGAPYESLNDTHKPRRCRRLGALLLFMLLPLLLLTIGLGVYFGLQAAETAGTQDAIEDAVPGGFYQDGVYFYPVPQNSVDNIYEVLGQREIDDCWQFLEDLGVTITTPYTGTATNPATTAAATTMAPTEAATTVAPAVTTAEAITHTGTMETGATEAVTTVAATTQAPTEEPTGTTVIEYTGTIPDCYALTTALERMNTPLVINLGSGVGRVMGSVGVVMGVMVAWTGIYFGI